LVANDGLLCIMADQLMNVLIKNTTFQSQIEEMVNDKIKAQMKKW